jgi:hypothetical protein
VAQQQSSKSVDDCVILHCLPLLHTQNYAKDLLIGALREKAGKPPVTPKAVTDGSGESTSSNSSPAITAPAAGSGTATTATAAELTLQTAAADVKSSSTSVVAVNKPTAELMQDSSSDGDSSTSAASDSASEEHKPKLTAWEEDQAEGWRS